MSVALVTNLKHRTTAAAMKIINFILINPAQAATGDWRQTASILKKKALWKRELQPLNLIFISRKILKANSEIVGGYKN